VPSIERSPLILVTPPDEQALVHTVVTTHNSKYAAAIKKWQRTLKGSKTWLYDAYTSFNEILDDPITYGFSANTSSYGQTDDFWA
jgi:phospholipase/lecithinase/hemolysin